MSFKLSLHGLEPETLCCDSSCQFFSLISFSLLITCTIHIVLYSFRTTHIRPITSTFDSSAMTRSDSNSPRQKLQAQKRVCDQWVILSCKWVDFSSKPPSFFDIRCRQRKIRCDENIGPNGDVLIPCLSCQNSRIPHNCRYDDPPQKKGPKPGSTAGLRILRDTERQAHAIRDRGDLFQQQRDPDLITNEILNFYIEYYLTNILPYFPIIDAQDLADQRQAMNHSERAYVQICALCAYITCTPNFAMDAAVPLNSKQRSGNIGEEFRKEAVRIRKNIDIQRGVCAATISTSILLSECYRRNGEYALGWTLCREATTFASPVNWKLDLTSRSDVMLYWIVFVIERYVLLHIIIFLIHGSHQES